VGNEEESESIFEERVELPEKERIKQLLLSANLQEELNSFLEMEVTSENIKLLGPSLRKDYFHLFGDINDYLNRLFTKLSIHPYFNKFFKAVWEKKKKENEKTEKIYDLTEVDHINLEADIIEIMSYFIPKVMLLIELLRAGTEKYEKYIFSPEESMQVQGVRSFGRDRCRTAYDLHKQGKNDGEIAVIIGKDTKQVAAYRTYWGRKVGDPEYMKAKERGVGVAEESSQQ